MPTHLRPFPGPVPPWSESMGPVIVRGNDNLLAAAVNQNAEELTATMSLAARGADAASLYDPRFAPEDRDSILASQVFGRYRA